MLLPDVNVWLALTFDSHVHHPAARAWFDALTGRTCLFCRLTQQGFLRLATNQKVFQTHALTLSGAWEKYDAFASDERVSFADEPAGIEPRWRIFTTGQTYSHRIWSDAYLAAFALVSGLGVVTFDQGFTRYAGVRVILLS